ncbi:MAG: hypothetical protein LC790_21795, partial [Actinobacteria bacterium]|nr:hypothetical protein [Actinomycetota bacterium]
PQAVVIDEDQEMMISKHLLRNRLELLVRGVMKLGMTHGTFAPRSESSTKNLFTLCHCCFSQSAQSRSWTQKVF